MTRSAKEQRKRGTRLPLPDGTVRLHRNRQFLDIEPAVPELENYFHTVRHVPVDDQAHGMRVEKVPFPLIWPQTDWFGTRYSQCYAGLEPLVREVLETAGFHVIQAGKRPGELEAPKLGNIDILDAVDTPVLDLIRQHDRGLIRYDAQHARPALLIAQVARAWPKAKIVVVATRLNVAGALRKELAKFLGKVNLFTGRRHPYRGSRVVVATPNRLADGAIAIEFRDIYIAVNPNELFFASFQDAGTEGIKCLRRARIYGLLADNTVVAPFERLWMTALFGMAEVFVPRHGYKMVPTDVVFSRIFGGQRPPNQKQDLAIKRLGVWHHHLRNRRIAGLFQILVSRDKRLLKKRFPDIARHIPGRLKGRVGLLVENVEHGLVLAKLLDKVPLVTAKHIWDEGLSDAQVELLKHGNTKEALDCDHVIVTRDGLDRADRFDIIIRADAGTGAAALTESWFAVPNDQDVRLLLIDFRDEHHPLLRRWSRERKVAYRRVGMNMLGETTSPMDLFVAGRPEVS